MSYCVPASAPIAHVTLARLEAEGGPPYRQRMDGKPRILRHLGDRFLPSRSSRPWGRLESGYVNVTGALMTAPTRRDKRFDAGASTNARWR